MNNTQDKEKQRLAQKYLLGACRELAPRVFAIQIGLGIIVATPFLIGRFCGDGWGLLAAIVAIAVWLCAIKLWFFPTVRLIWSVFLVVLVFFAIFEAARFYRH